VAQVPATVLTVEYVDGSEGMDASLKAIEQRIARIEQMVRELHEATSRLAAEMGSKAGKEPQSGHSPGGRVQRAQGESVQRTAATAGAEPTPAEGAEDQFGVPTRYAADESHQKAWQVAQLIASDLEAYYEDQVREGVANDNFFELLQVPISEARRSYEEKVDGRVLQEFDYFTLVLKRLIARKRRELAREQTSE